MKYVHLDFETYSDIDLTKQGAMIYATHPSTEVLMLGWQIDDGMIHLWDCKSGEPFPQRLQIALNNPDVLLKAFNAQFERLIFKHVLQWDIQYYRWRCSMCRAYSLSFTGGLDSVLEQFLPHHRKDPKGKALIRRFSMPQPKSRKIVRWDNTNDPQGYEEFKQYCIQDVKVEHELSDALAEYPYSEREIDHYLLDQKINDAGVPVDPHLISQAILAAKTEKKIALDKMKKLTGLNNPNSGQQLHQWLEEQGAPLPNLQKETVRDEIKKIDNEVVKGEPLEMFQPVYEVLHLKQQIAKTSITKWSAFQKHTTDDSRVYGMFQFAGASRTSRWAGRAVQLHNLARGGNTTKDPVTLADCLSQHGHSGLTLMYGDPLMALSDSIRCAITAPKGKLLNVSDLSSIESRVVGWFADCKAINDTFAEGKDTYKVFATHLYRIAYEEVTKVQRTFSKPPVLGGAYMLSGGEVKKNGDKTGLLAYAASMGVEMTPEFAHESIRVFREDLFPEIPVFWNWCRNAVFHTTITGAICQGPHGLVTEKYKEFLLLWLPSGRAIAYHKPMILPRRMPWGEVKDAFTYIGKDKYKNHKWDRIQAHAGLLTENIVQAFARDILAEWMQRIDERGFKIVGHVHDEAIVEDEDDVVEDMNDCIRSGVPWAPGLLLDAGGFTTRRYYKD